MNHPSTYRLMRHECGHLVTALALGIPVKEARIDSPVDDDPTCAGRVTLGGGIRSRRSLRNRLAAAVAGPLAVDREIPFPPDAGEGGDESAAAFYVGALDMSRGEYEVLCGLVRDFLDTQLVRDATLVFSNALHEEGVLRHDRILELERETFLAGPPSSMAGSLVATPGGPASTEPVPASSLHTDPTAGRASNLAAAAPTPDHVPGGPPPAGTIPVETSLSPGACGRSRLPVGYRESRSRRAAR